jgi:tetratricopeptide (TPR) repeat protein
LDRSLTSAERLGRRPREVHDIRQAVVSMSIAIDDAYYLRAAPAWFARLEQDSGLADYRALSQVTDAGERLRQALTAAAQRYAATPEHERVLSPELAIRGLAYYVVVSIAIGSRMQDAALVTSLPAVLEPFAALSPALHAIWQNSIATRESNCDNQPEGARRRWLDVLDALARIPAGEVSYVTAVRRAIIYGIGLTEARLGLAHATEQRAVMLDDDPLQAVSAMSLRKIARLHQGDFTGAERYRKAGERLALHANMRSMFSSTLQAELIAYALAGDLTGIGQVAEQIAPFAARHAGWLPYKWLAQGYFEQTRGRLEDALAAFERGLSETSPPQGNGWLRLEATSMEVLVQLGRVAEARTRGERALELCMRAGIRAASWPIQRALALVEAKVGDYEGASQRLAGVITEMTALGATGLELGATYEARTRIAIWHSDEDAIVEFARRTAKEYRYGQGSSLAARYERLMNEARGRGVAALPLLEEFQTKLATSHLYGASAASLVVHTLAGAGSAQDRAERLLRVLCEAQGAHVGHLYVYAANGLERVASRGPSATDGALDEFVRGYVEQQLDAASFASRVVTSEDARSTWIGPTHNALMPLLLMAEVDGEKRCIGAVLLEASGAGATALTLRTQHVLDAVAEYLLRAGDTRPAAPGRALPL